jgi:ABC-type Fe3+-hydroxamate transport system substrate-binding protein
MPKIEEILMRHAIITTILALLLAACSGSSSGTTEAPDEAAGCEDAPQQVLDYLATGFVNDALTLESGRVVESHDYPGVWIVAGVLGGAEDLIGDADAIGIWAIRAGKWPTDYVGAVAVDSVAQATTTWSDDVDIVVTAATDGVRVAEACTLAALSG